jgi:L-ascorbate metabolism protein UlaG (beta-lactamase superfamily)
MSGGSNSSHPLMQTTIPAGAVGIHWFGQASFALKDATGAIVLVDPWFPQNRPPEKFIHSEPPFDARTMKVDAVLLTHNHSDHTCAESLARIAATSPGVRIIGTRESIEKLRTSGMEDRRFQIVGPGDSVEAATFRAHAVLSKLPDTSPMLHLGYVIETGGGRIYVSGDPQNDFGTNPRLLEPVAALGPDIGFLTTHPTEGEFPFFEGTARTARAIGLKAAVPSHYACLVKRTYDPHQWAEAFPGATPLRIIVPYDGFIAYSAKQNWVRAGY